MKKLLLLTILSVTTNVLYSQGTGIGGFVRQGQLVNHNFTDKVNYYTPVVSSGLSFYSENKFIDLGVFMDKNDFVGYYTYFGSTEYSKTIEQNWLILLNWFGEVTLLSQQGEYNQSWIQTAGFSPVLAKPLPWGMFAIALTTGVAHNDQTISFNSRVVLHFGIPIISTKQ